MFLARYACDVFLHVLLERDSEVCLREILDLMVCHLSRAHSIWNGRKSHSSNQVYKSRIVQGIGIGHIKKNVGSKIQKAKKTDYVNQYLEDNFVSSQWKNNTS